MGFFPIAAIAFLGFLCVAALVVFAFVFWILMIVDVVKRDFKKGEEKIVWLLIILFFHFIGALVYYFVVKRKT